MKRMVLTRKQLDDWRRWHDERMKDLDYPPPIVDELTKARERFWAGIPQREPA